MTCRQGPKNGPRGRSCARLTFKRALVACFDLQHTWVPVLKTCGGAREPANFHEKPLAETAVRAGLRRVYTAGRTLIRLPAVRLSPADARQPTCSATRVAFRGPRLLSTTLSGASRRPTRLGSERIRRPDPDSVGALWRNR